MPKSSSFGSAFRGDENVGWLQIAMDDQVLMRIADGGADLAKELEPLTNVEPMRFAVVQECLAVRHTP